jgi:hypothetical protein
LITYGQPTRIEHAAKPCKPLNNGGLVLNLSLTLQRIKNMRSQNLTPKERERLYYIQGATAAAREMARIDDLAVEVARYRCALEAIYEAGKTGCMDSRQCAAAAYEVL